MSAVLKEVFNVIDREKAFSSSVDTDWQKFVKTNDINPNIKSYSLGILPSQQGYSFFNYIPNNPIEQQAKRVVQNLVETISITKIGLILSSKESNGKTHLVVSLAKALLIENIMQPRFVNSMELVNQLDPDLSLITEAERYSLKEKVNKADLLILDDFAREAYSEAQRTNLEDIIHFRHKNILPLIITTKLNLDDFCRALTLPIYSRLQEMCEFISLTPIT